jgi:hypothetical protein
MKAHYEPFVRLIEIFRRLRANDRTAPMQSFVVYALVICPAILASTTTSNDDNDNINSPIVWMALQSGAALFAYSKSCRTLSVHVILALRFTVREEFEMLLLLVDVFPELCFAQWLVLWSSFLKVLRTHGFVPACSNILPEKVLHEAIPDGDRVAVSKQRIVVFERFFGVLAILISSMDPLLQVSIVGGKLLELELLVLLEHSMHYFWLHIQSNMTSMYFLFKDILGQAVLPLFFFFRHIEAMALDTNENNDKSRVCIKSHHWKLTIRFEAMSVKIDPT